MVEGEVFKNWSMHANGSVKFKGRLCVSTDLELRNEILANAHRTKYEERHHLICSQCPNLLASESWASKTCKVVTYTLVEMRSHYYGLCDRVYKNQKQKNKMKYGLLWIALRRKQDNTIHNSSIIFEVNLSKIWYKISFWWIGCNILVF